MYGGLTPSAHLHSQAKGALDWDERAQAYLPGRVKALHHDGMATDRGKLSNINALGIVSAAIGRTIPEVGLTTFRAPNTPVTFGTLAGSARGDLFDPVRTTPIHGWAVERGAVFEDVGQWKRARFFPRAGENMDATVARECGGVRERVGLLTHRR